MAGPVTLWPPPVWVFARGASADPWQLRQSVTQSPTVAAW